MYPYPSQHDCRVELVSLCAETSAVAEDWPCFLTNLLATEQERWHLETNVVDIDGLSPKIAITAIAIAFESISPYVIPQFSWHRGQDRLVHACGEPVGTDRSQSRCSTLGVEEDLEDQEVMSVERSDPREGA